LTPIKPSEFKGSSKHSSDAPVPWTLATISSGYYRNLRTANQPWNARSADTIEGALGFFHPQSTLRLRASQDDPLTSGELNQFVERLMSTARKARSKFVIVYFIGHTLSWPNGDIAIVLGDAVEIPKNSTVNTPMMQLRRGSVKMWVLFSSWRTR